MQPKIFPVHILKLTLQSGTEGNRVELAGAELATGMGRIVHAFTGCVISLTRVCVDDVKVNLGYCSDVSYK